MPMSIAPPSMPALELNFSPKKQPSLTPIAASMNVMMPMAVAAIHIFTCMNAMVIPTVRASMLVATAMIRDRKSVV